MPARGPTLSSNLRKLNDDFDVVGCSLQGLLEILRFFIAGDQAAEPLRVEASQPLIRFVPVTLVRVHTAHQHIVFQDSAAATSATARVVTPPVPTPVRQTTPPAPIFWTESPSTDPTPVHSTMTSGSNARSKTLPE